MQKIINILVLFLFAFTAEAQVIDSLNHPAKPEGGVQNLAIKYYGIDFTKEQRKKLKDVEVEFIFFIDEKGVPSLSEVNGINDSAIVDSLRKKTSEVPAFSPKITNGVPEPSVYFMQLVFPTYKMTEYQWGYLEARAYREAKIEDFEYITISKQGVNMVFAGIANQFIGNISNHLGFGGGLKIDITYSGKKSFHYGADLSFYGNTLKKNYTLNTTREQFSSPPTLLVSGVFGKEIKRFIIQAEISSAIQNITENKGNSDPDWVQLHGWSPGIVANYMIPISRNKTMYYYGSPNVFSHYLNLHFGIRGIFLSINEARGGMIELGVGYRFSQRVVTEYKLKEEFLKRKPSR